MPKSLYSILFGSILSVGVLSMAACSKIVQVGPPQNKVVASSVFTDSSLATSATMAMYPNINSEEPPIVPLIGVYGDELTDINGGSQALPFVSSALLPTTTSSNNVWTYLYTVIYDANAILAGLSGASTGDISSSLQARLTGEAYFCRAYAYFYLTNLYGNVPLVLTTDVNQTASVSKTASATIYSQVIADLQTAETLLQGSYPGEQPVRATKWASAALLARAYLFTGKYQQADSAATAVINSNAFSLAPVTSVFLETSNETILSIYNTTGYTIGSLLLPSSATALPPYALDSALYNAFSPTDARTNWIGTAKVSGTTYHYADKYKARTTTTGANAEFYILLRLAEQYLIRAEAKENEQDIPDAISDLNMVHTRAGLSPLSNNVSAAQCDSLIQAERRKELFVENLNRFLDLKRKGTINQIMRALKPTTWLSTDTLLPIPQNEITINPNLTQNSGYN